MDGCSLWLVAIPRVYVVSGGYTRVSLLGLIHVSLILLSLQLCTLLQYVLSPYNY